MNFAYNGRVQLDTTNVQSILVGASFLHLQVVKEACCEFLRNRYDRALAETLGKGFDFKAYILSDSALFV